jgi:8-oxo-dGTP pyrophosphatase MutT (NUDIX family)
MEQNHQAFAPEAATDEPASPLNPPVRGAPDFATEAERAAYARGVADARSEGPADSSPPAFDFDPAETRHRRDGITPEKQRDYIEALADTGIARTAAARIGVTEQSVNRFRRRADAVSFDLACEAARRFGARRIRDTAWERAIEGTVRGHYYHGELKSEERVHDNRLLIYLLGKTEHLLEEPEDAPAVAANWEPWVEAIEQGAPPPDLNPPVPSDVEGAGRDDIPPSDVFDGGDCWEDEDGIWWTSFPPPAGFGGREDGTPGDPDYQRSFSEAEQAVFDADMAQESAEAVAYEIRRRDLYFGFAGGRAGDEDFSSLGHEPYEPLEPSAPPADAAIDRSMTDDPLSRAERPAARILLLDPDGRILLFRFDPGDRPAFWATPGGALDPGEDFATGARRELLEETGLDLDCGPEVARRVVEFVTLEDVPVRADERYFLVRTDTAEIATAGHTELERRVMRDWRWFTPAEIAAHDEAIFPENLVAMLEAADHGGPHER